MTNVDCKSQSILHPTRHPVLTPLSPRSMYCETITSAFENLKNAEGKFWDNHTNDPKTTKIGGWGHLIDPSSGEPSVPYKNKARLTVFMTKLTESRTEKVPDLCYWVEGSLAGSSVETPKTCQWVLDCFGAGMGSPSGCLFFFFCLQTCVTLLVEDFVELRTLDLKKSYYHSGPFMWPNELWIRPHNRATKAQAPGCQRSSCRSVQRGREGDRYNQRRSWSVGWG